MDAEIEDIGAYHALHDLNGEFKPHKVVKRGPYYHSVCERGFIRATYSSMGDMWGDVAYFGPLLKVKAKEEDWTESQAIIEKGGMPPTYGTGNRNLPRMLK